MVCSLDLAFRSAMYALTKLEKLHKRDVQFKFLMQNFDTSTSDGKLLYTVAARLLAEWECQILSEHNKQGWKGPSADLRD